MAEPYPRLQLIRPVVASQHRWSRSHGALGGAAVWERLVNLPTAVVGCGRSGSLAAGALARLGLRELMLIDPDTIESHNLGEMAVIHDADLGRPKAAALAWRLRDQLSHWPAQYQAVTAPAQHPEGLAALKRCRVLVCCADQDMARLTVALIACLYHQVLLDIGTGIQMGTTGERQMGADIRLIVPGDGCLLCRGNLSDYRQALTRLCEPAAVEPATDWQEQRAGSLHSLNQIAVGIGLRLLEDLVAERVQGSVWAHLEFDPAGRLTVSYPPVAPPETSCTLCVQAGRGDEGLVWPS